MTAFFSGTDTSTLAEEGSDTNNFVSLIVNNAGNYVAAITRRFKTVNKVHSTFHASMFGDEDIQGETDFEKPVEYLEYYPLIVEKAEVPDDMSALSKRLKDIQDRKKAPVHTSKPLYEDIYDRYPTRPTTSFTDYYRANRELEGNLFEKVTTPQTPEKKTIDDEDVDIQELLDISVTPEILDAMLNKLLLGNPMANAKSINRNVWINNMVTVCERSFPNFTGYAEFMEGLCEYITSYTEDPKLDTFETSYRQSIYAAHLISELEEYKGNEYLDIILECLYKYIC